MKYNKKMDTDRQETEDKLSVLYIFKFLDGSSRHFEVCLDPKTMNIITPKEPPPEWAAFSFHTCGICSIKDGGSEYCPVAVNLSGIVETFNTVSSKDSVHVSIMTKNRDYAKSTNLKEGLSGLIGMCMASSPCSILGKLKPMVRYHLPFATLEESAFRVASMYLLVQYFLARRGGTADWKLKGLTKIYEDIQAVNAGMSERLRLAAREDASLEAIASLDYTASLLPHMVNETLDDIEASLSSYLEDL